METYNPYEVLGVRQSATQEEIRDAYIMLAKKYHPDNYRNHPLSDVAQTKMQEINVAYDYLTRHDGSTASGKNSYSYEQGSTQASGGTAWQQANSGPAWGQANAGPSDPGNQQSNYNFWGNNRNPNDRNFYNYNRGGDGRRGGCCSDLCMCFCLDSCCECMGGDLCSCC